MLEPVVPVHRRKVRRRFVADEILFGTSAINQRPTHNLFYPTFVEVDAWSESCHGTTITDNSALHPIPLPTSQTALR